MHLLSSHYRSEFLATPQLIRLIHAEGHAGFEPTLLIKGSTLLLKYIVSGVRMQLVFAPLGDRLLYALRVYDDGDKPATVWSVLERDTEKAAVEALVRGEPCQIFLFNELAVNVAWTEARLTVKPSVLEHVASACTGEVDYRAFKQDAFALLDQLKEKESDAKTALVDVPDDLMWHPIFNHFITNRASSSRVNLFDNDEGGQQEQLVVWLTDSLHPSGAFHSPQIPKGKGFRELTDILLSHEFGSVLIESKVLAVLTREKLPNRKKLARDVSAHVLKAANQLRGGMRRLKDGAPVTNKDGKPIEVERTHPMHGVILIPDLELIEDRQSFGVPFMREFMRSTGGFLHLLDISELLRVVQAAEMIAAKGKTTTPMMAFDFYLLERVKECVAAGTLCIEVLLRFRDE